MEDEAGEMKSGMQCTLVALNGTPSDDHDVFFNLRMTCFINSTFYAIIMIYQCIIIFLMWQKWVSISYICH